jgi:hypothetical protein
MSGPRGLSITSTANLPNGATTVTGAPQDLTSFAMFLGDSGQITITAPALTTAELPDGQTMTYSIEGYKDSSFHDPVPLLPAAVVQTGAGGAGAAGQSVTLSIPRKLLRWLRVSIVNSGAGNPSAKTVSLDIEY